MSSVPPPAARRLVGRQLPLGVARAHLDRLAAGDGGLVLLAGEAGIGKTRLADEVAALAVERGATVVWATSWQGEGAPPLWPWTQVLRALGVDDDLLGEEEPASAGTSAAARFAQAAAVADALRAGAAGAPLLVVLDDLQWADLATVRVLNAVAPMLRRVSCLLLGTYRPDELDRESVAELARVGTTVALARLSHDEASDLLRLAVGTDVPASAVQAIVERSGGNPLFVWEFGQLLAQSGRLDVAPAAVPDAAAAVIERRLARLSETAMAMLRVGAVTGRRFTVEVVARVGEVPLAQAEAGAGEAVGAGLAVVVDDGRAHELVHDLVRDVVLEGIPRADRAELHRRAAAVLAERAARDPSLHTAVAAHLDAAGPAHAAEAARHWELAAARAERLLAHADAATLLGRVAAADPARRGDLALRQGELLLLAGDLDAARERFERAIDAGRETSDPVLLARATLGLGTGPVAWEAPLPSGEHAARVVEALAGLPEDAIGLRSLLLARLSIVGVTPTTMAVARERAGEALRLAEQVDDPATIATALAAVNDAHGGPAHTMLRRDNADAIVELAALAGDRVLELLGYRFRLVAELEVGEIAAADRSIRAFEQLAGELRQPLVSWYVPLFRGMRALLAGDPAQAVALAEEVRRAGEVMGSTNAVLLGATLLMGAEVALGRQPDDPSFDGMVGIDPAEWASYAAGIAYANVLSGHRGRAREMLRLHADNGFRRIGDDAEHLATLQSFGRTALALGDLDAAASVAELLAPHAGLWIVDGIAACCWGPVDLELGRLALALGRPAEALDHLARAGAAVAAAGTPLLALDVAALEEQARAAAGRTEPDGDAAPPRPAVPSGADAVFRLDGAFWTLTYRGTTAVVKDAKGLHDLARLLREPGREVHVLDLAGTRGDPAGEALARSGDVGELLDARARAEYRRRIAELEDEIAEADDRADLARGERARIELDFLTSELAAAVGLDGRARRAGDPVERARKAVTGRIRLSIGRLEPHHPDLARHLTNAVRTGVYCAYAPETPVAWATF